MLNIGECDGKWLVLYVQRRREVQVAQTLRSNGYEEFVPLAKKRWPQKRESTHDPIPLFQGYIFCRFNRNLRWRIVETPGVLKIVNFGGNIAIVPDETIEQIRLFQDVGDGLQIYPMPILGSMVRVRSGPLAGLRGKMVEMNGNNHLTLSIETINRSISVKINNADIEYLPK